MNKNTEYFITRQKKAKKKYFENDIYPHRYVLVLTNKCNLACSFCFQDKSHLPGSLDLEGWKNLVDQFPSDSWVTLTGGEPLAFKEFNNIFLHITKKFKCNLISNGILLSSEKIDLLLSQKNFSTLSISVDNIGNTLRDVKPSQWEHSENMMRLFSDRKKNYRDDVILDTKTVVLDENADDLLDIHKYCLEDLKADTHSFQFLKGAPIQFSDLMYNYEKMFTEVEAYKYKKFQTIKEQLIKISEYNDNNEKSTFLHPKFGDVNETKTFNQKDIYKLNLIKHNPKLFKPCMAPWESVHINTDGNLFPCMAISMGNIIEKSLKNVLKSETFFIFRNTIKKYGTVPGCNRCGYLKP